MLTLWIAMAHAAPTSVVYYDQAPTSLLPLYARSPADSRAHELVFDRLFYRTAIS